METTGTADRRSARSGPLVRTAGTRQRTAVAVIGAGPRGLGVLERLAANAADGPAEPGLDIHLVDPWAPGSGRIWRRGQAPLLWMNSTAADVTLWPDETVEMAGPVRSGPTLWEWIQAHHDELAADPEVGPSVVGLHAGSFVSRSVQARYLGAVLDRVLAELPASVRVHLHRARAVDVTDEADATGDPRAPGADDRVAGRQSVRLDSGAVLQVDAVVLAQGHLDTGPGAAERARTDFADRHGLTYVAPAYTADVDASVVPEREDVLVSGLGLAFVDWVVVLAESRGGRFDRAADGTLVYTPSGREPVLYAGSRRGVPYHAKISYPFPSRRPPVPRFFGPAAFGPGTPALLDVETDVWPRLAKDLCLAHYAELFAGHPDRVRGDWDTFLDGFAAQAWGTPGSEQVIAAAVPDVEDRLDLARLARPFADRVFTGADDVQDAVRDHVAADLARRSDPAFSSDAAVFTALLTVYAVLAGLVRDGRIPPEVAAREVESQFHAFFSFMASGPPPERLEQVLALSRAGVVRFLGPDLRVVLDEERGVFSASTALGEDAFSARTLIDARLPPASVQDTTDPLLRALADRGRAMNAPGTGKLAVDPDQRVVRVSGEPEPARYALGPWVVGNGWAPAFPRPRLNGGFFRQDDALARTVLAAVGARTV